MRLTYSWMMTAIVSVAFFAAGCAGGESGDDPALGAPPPVHTLGDPNGTAGANGLPPEGYHPNALTLDNILRAPLASANSHEMTSPTVGTLVQTTDGNKLFGYAIGCALASDDYVTYTVPETATRYTFRGAGMLTTASTWRAQALGTQARLDVHACIAARLNPTGTTVRIWLGGKDVSETTAPTDFAYTEALWGAYYGATLGPVIRVWPDKTWARACEDENYSLDAAAHTRVCGKYPGTCQLTVGSMANECTQDAFGKWACAGMPVIQTRLQTADWDTIHTSCQLKP